MTCKKIMPLALLACLAALLLCAPAFAAGIGKDGTIAAVKKSLLT